MQPETFRNLVLGKLPAADLALVAPHLERVELPHRHRLAQADRRIDRIYFLDSGIASVTTSAPRDKPIEIGMIGREGVTNLPVILGVDRAPSDTFMQIPGAGHAMPAGALRAGMEESVSLARWLLRCAQAFMVQTASTILANGRATLPERLARWLLMAHDRLEGDEVPLTHEFLAIMLGVRRSGVTVALKQFEDEGLVAGERSLVVVLDRTGLEARAGGFYGTAEAELRRLLGTSAV
jgi:CRP-like cAMP-binding protein